MQEKHAMAGDTLFFAFMVLFIGSIVRIGASIYLPAMPLIAEELHVSKAMMSNTLTVYFVVFASFTLVAGMLSDAYGRKRILMSGMFFFMLGAIICALSDAYEMLMFGRIVQAFGASMVPGTLIAMIRDACSEFKVVSLMGWLTVLSGLFLVAAPMLGGVLTHFSGWSANFWFLALFTFMVLILAYFKMQETHHQKQRTPLNLRNTAQNMWKMLSSSAYMLALLPVIAFYAVQGAFLAAAPFILMDEYGLNPVMFGISNVNIVIGLFSGRYLGMYLLKRYDASAVYRYSAYLALLVTFLFTLVFLELIHGLFLFLVLSGIFATLFGMLAPLGMKTSISSFRSVSGVAAALQSALLFTASGLGSAGVGMLMYFFESMSAERVFALLTLSLCLLAAGVSYRSRTLVTPQ